MYKFIDFKKIFEAEETATPIETVTPVQQPQALSGKNADILLTLSEQDQDELNDLLENNSSLKLFTRPAQVVDKTDSTKKLGEINLIFAIANSKEKNAQFPVIPELSDEEKRKTQIFKLYKEQIHIDELNSGPVTVSLKTKPDDDKSAVNIIIVAAKEQPTATQTADTEPVAPANAAETEPTPEEIALSTGEMVGSNPKKYESNMPKAIKNFDQFVGESKKKWIADIDMKTGALKKELGDDELTAADLKKAEAKLAKKDKDKKKKGLQLNPKDAKTHKRVVLAKNLMKASGAISESRQDKIKGAKDQLIKIHEVIEKLIKKTSK